LKTSIRLLSNFYNHYLYISQYIGLLALVLIPVGLLFSRGLLSIGFITFISNWFLEAEFKRKWKLLKTYKLEIIICLVFLIHLIGMIYTHNIEAGLKDLKIKLPLLFPIFLISSNGLLKKLNSNFLILLFAFTTVAASLAGFMRFEYYLDYQTVDDLKDITFMGQNIMLSLFVNFSIFIFYNELYLNWYKKQTYLRIILLLNILWLIVFLYLLNSLTGYFTFIVLFLYTFLSLLTTIKRKTVLIIILIFSLSGIIITLYINNLIVDFYKTEQIDFQNLEKYTKNGRAYNFNTNSKRTENGHYIDIYVNTNELEKEWSKISSMSFSGKDKKGQMLSETLIRYLTSKGLRKDSAAVSQLKKNEINYIENGCANYKYINKYSLESRIYNIIWQINTFKTTGNANAQSISQRIEFFKSAKYIIKQNFWFGVGSGDVMDTFNETLEKISPTLDKSFRNRVHNQYVVEFIALGVIGFLLFLVIIFYPVYKLKIWKYYIFSVFYLIILLSFLTDNPLETQLGVSFFSFFYAILVFKSAKLTAIE